MSDEPFGVSAEGFAIVPYQLMVEAAQAAKRGPGEPREIGAASLVMVYAVLYKHGHGSADGCWCSQATVSEETGVSLKVVRRALAWLEETGWVRGNHRSGTTTVYQVITQDPGRKRPRSKTTQVENDLGGRAKMTQGGRAKTTYKQDPNNKIPRTKSPKEGSAASKAPADPLTGRKLPSDVVPPELQDCAALLAEFWEVKKGTRSSRVFNRLCGKLRQWSPGQRREALESAIANGWGDVFQPRGQRQGSAGTSTERQEAARQRVVAFFEQHDPLARGDEPWPSASTTSAAAFWDCSSSGPSPSSSTMPALGLPG